MDTAETKPRRRKLPFWLRIALGIVIAIFTLVTVGVGLRFWITSDGGRAFITSQIDGRKLGPLGTIRVQGLKGDPLEAATIADIALVDDDGVWLRAKDARIEWTPSALFAGELEIQKVNLKIVDMLRIPRVTAPPEEGSAPDIGLSLDEVTIDDLHIAEAVMGADAHYKIAGGASRRRDASGFAKLTLAPIAGPADRADISAAWSAVGALKGVATVVGPADGLVAALAQGPEDKPVAFEGKVDGTLDIFSGSARLAFGDEQAATFSIARNAAAATLTADVAADRWPLLEPLAQRTGGSLKLEGRADLATLARSPLSFRLLAPAGTIDLSTTMDFSTWSIPETFRLAATQLDLASLAPPLSGKVDADGDLVRIGLADFQWKGAATVTRAAWPSGGAARISAPLTIGKDGSIISWETSGAAVEGGQVDALRNLAPARYTVTSRGDVNLKTQTVEIYQGQIRGAPGDVSARGAYRIRTGELALDGAARFSRLADVAPLTGSAGGQWSVRRASTNSPIRITADALGRNVSSSITALAQLLGPTPRLRLTSVVRDGRFTIESGRIEGAGIRADMTGRVADNGSITARANGALARPFDASGATVRSLSFTADVSGNTRAPLVALRLTDGLVSTAALTFEGLSGDAEMRLGEAITGDFSLVGASGGQPFNAAGRIQAGEGDWRIVGFNANLGQLKLTAPRLAFSEGAFSMTFDASGPLAGIAGIERGTLNAGGTIKVDEDLAVDVTGRLANLRSGVMRLDLVTFDADASGDTATVKAQAKGTLGAPIDITLNATGARADDTWSGQATLEGAIDQLPVKTTRPATWRAGAGGWSVDSELSAFDGSLNAALASSPGSASAKFELNGVNLRAISRLARVTPINGRITGAASFANGSAPATGDISLTIANANPVGVTADPVSLTITARLRDGVLASSASGEGQGFKLAATSREEMIIGQGFDIKPDTTTPLMAQLDLTGRAEQLWALFGPEDQSLRGQLQANVRVGGTLSRPDLSGGFSVAEGVYDHGETGLSLRNISARGEFDENTARIINLSANDRQGGRLTGEGTITWAGDVSGGVNFTADSLRALGRDDRLVIVSGKGDVALDSDAIRISGDFVVAQARISIEQSASAKIPTLTGIRRVNFPNQDEIAPAVAQPWQRPMQLDLRVTAPRRIVVFGRGLDTEWSANVHVTGPISDPVIDGAATLVRGDLDLAGRRFQFDTGTIDLDGPIRAARIDIAAERTAADISASVHVTGTPVEPKFTLESTPSLPQDEILARVLFGRSAAELTGFEAAQLAAGLAQLAGGNAGFDPVGLVRQATGLDRVTFGAEDGIASVSAGKYIAEDVYVQVGAGGAGGVGAEVEWEPQDNLSITSSAQGNGDTKIAIRWKRDY